MPCQQPVAGVARWCYDVVVVVSAETWWAVGGERGEGVADDVCKCMCGGGGVTAMGGAATWQLW
jgi:hypothetical protein